jgi:hypothetical protein
MFRSYAFSVSVVRSIVPEHPGGIICLDGISLPLNQFNTCPVGQGCAVDSKK